jgi:hypothetical protein
MLFNGSYLSGEVISHLLHVVNGILEYLSH